MAVDVDNCGQSDFLCLIKVNPGKIIDDAVEFDSCTADIAEACIAEETHRAKWFAWNENWKRSAATLEELKQLRLDKCLIGSKRDMKISTPVEPL